MQRVWMQQPIYAHLWLAALWLTVVAAPAQAAPPESAEGEAQRATADMEMPPRFTLWEDGEGFIKPVLQIGALLAGYVPKSEQNDALASRLSSLALTRFGLEGELFGFVRFRSVFERNIGYNLTRNGPVGTSVWEGTASLQARENYVQLYTGGLTVTGGIVLDPASVDFISENVLDAFGMDPYVRDPLLVSGYSQGQGALVRYMYEGLAAGFSFTAGTPLASSLSFGFGGNVSALGTLFTAPLRAISNGIPGSDIQMTVFSPSLGYAHRLFEVKAAGQFTRVDVDVTQDEDQSLSGFNLRLTAQLRLFDDLFRVFGSGAYRENQQLAIPDLTTRTDDYEGFVAGGGLDLHLDRFGVGGQYYYLHSVLSETSNLTNHYLNVGTTYWLEPKHTSLGLRWGRTMSDAEPTTPRLETTDSFILSLRLLI